MPSNNEETVKKLNKLIENLRNIYGISFDEILKLTSEVKKDEEKKYLIPIEVLKNRDLGALESITVYLKDEKEMKFSEIAKALDRDDRTIWATYHKAKEKLKK